MKAIPIYDYQTQTLLQKLQTTLDTYLYINKGFHEFKTRGMTCSRDIREEWENDPGRRTIERQIEKVKSLTMPIRIDIVYELNDMVIELGACNDLNVRQRHHWYDHIKPYNYNKLNEQAMSIPLYTVHAFIDGEQSESEAIAKKYNCEELNKFLNDIFDGDLKDVVYYK